MMNMWQNYVDNYNKFQWWLSGIFYGFYLGKWYQEIKQTQKIWQHLTVEYFTFYDAMKLTFDLKFYIVETTPQITEWLLLHDYTFYSNCSCGTNNLTHEIDCTVFQSEESDGTWIS